MNDNTKLLGTFVLGAIAGIAIVKLLESDTGKELIAELKGKAESTADGIKEKISNLESELAELLKTQTEQPTDNNV